MLNKVYVEQYDRLFQEHVSYKLPCCISVQYRLHAIH